MAATANVSIRADISQLTKQLKSMPGITAAEAKRMVAELKKSMAEATAAAKAANAEVAKGAQAAGKAGQAGAAGMAEMGKQSGQAKEAMSQFGSALSVVSPELGGMVTRASALTGALQGAAKASGLAGAAFPVLALAVAAVGAAVWAYQENAKIAHQETRELGGSVDGLSLSLADLEKMQEAGTRALDGFRESVRGAALETAVLRGELTELEAREQEAARAAALSIKPGIDAAAAAITSAQKDVERLTIHMERYKATLDDPDIYMTDPTEELAAAKARLKSAEEHLEALRQERKAGQEVITTALELADAQKLGQEAGRRRAQESAKAEKEEADALREQEAALGRATAARAAMEAARKAALADTLTGEEAIIEARDRQLEQLREEAMISGDRKTAALAMAAVEQRAERDLETLRRKNHDAEMVRMDQETQKLQAETQARSNAIMGAAGTMFRGIADVAEWAAEEAGKTQSKAAHRWLVLAKAAAVAEIVINQASAIMAAWKAYAGIPVVGPALAGVATAGLVAVGAAQIANVSQQEIPTFATGGMVQTIPADHGLFSVANQGAPEAVLNRRATAALGGERAVDSLNAGGSASQVVVVEQVYGHRVYDRFVVDNLRKGGPLDDALTQRAIKPGHSRRRL